MHNILRRDKQQETNVTKSLNISSDRANVARGHSIVDVKP